MKLLFCPNCNDLFKLVIHELRSCKCGRVMGQATDNTYAVVNGYGFSIELDNHALQDALKKFDGMEMDKPYEYYRDNVQVATWVLPHCGPGNPRTQIGKLASK